MKKPKIFTGLQTFTYLEVNNILYIPSFYKEILNRSRINYDEINTLVKFILTNFGNEKICKLLLGMILFNDIPEPILSKFFARPYTLESPFYGIMNQNLIKKNFDIYSIYIKLLYKGIINGSYQPKTDCILYRRTKLKNMKLIILRICLKKK